MMGDGAAVTPVDPIVRAPEDGEIGFVFDTKHAIGFVTDFGVSLLIHVGIDTVKAERSRLRGITACRPQAMQIAQAVRECVSLVEQQTHKRMDVMSLAYNRLMNHVRYMVAGP